MTAGNRTTRRMPVTAVAFCCLTLVLLLAGPVSSAAAANKAWTVMIYLNADNNLEDMAPADFINEMCTPGSNADVNVVALYDRNPGYDTTYGDWTSTKLFYCTAGETPTAANAVADWGERNMGDRQTLVDFVSYCKANYPADHYVMCWWDHGWCWYPGYYIEKDDTSADTLDLDEQMAGFAVTGGVDIMACDQCQMQMVDVDSCWRPYAQYVVASEDMVNWDGLDYSALATAIRANPSITPEALAYDMGVHCGAADVAPYPPSDSYCYSVIALDSRYDALVTAVDEWAVAMRNGLPANQHAYDLARNATKYYTGDGNDIDLYDAAYNVKAQVSDPNIKAKCDAVMAAVNSAVIYNWTNGKKSQAGSHGIAIWWPATVNDLKKPGDSTHADWADWTYYRTEIPFCRQSAWDSFVGAYATADLTAPTTTSSADTAWHASPYSFTLSASDNVGGSGVFDTQFKLPGDANWRSGTSVTLRTWKRYGGSGPMEVALRSSDLAANYETPQLLAVKMDGLAPRTSDDAPAGAHNHDVTVHFTASDAHSGVAQTWYALDGGPWTAASQVTVTAPANDGTHWIHYYSVDNVGNLETREHVCSVLIDNSGGSLAPKSVAPRPLVRKQVASRR